MPTRSRRLGNSSALAVISLVASLAACGGNGPTGPSQDDTFPVRVTTGNQCALGGVPQSAIFFVTGFSSRATDPNAPPPLEARVRVGEEVKISLQLQGCGVHNRESWISTDTSVASVTPVPASLPPGFQVVPSFPQATVTAIAPGQFTVFVDFTAMDDKRYRTTIGYCPLDAQYPGFPSLGPCGNPKLIGTVRVVE